MSRIMSGHCVDYFHDKSGSWRIEASSDMLCSVMKSDTQPSSATSNHITGIVRHWLQAYFNGSPSPFPTEVQLDTRFHTDFQKHVWNIVLRVPFGQSRTYSEIAKEYGDVNASRAVGTAVGKNPFAIVIPCHRVLGKNGALTGYRWGEETKRSLLTHEGHPSFRQASLF